MSIGITTWMLHYRNEKPVEIWGQPSECEFNAMLLKADKAKAERLLMFAQYKHLNAPLTLSSDALVAGSTFQEEDFNFSRTQIPAPFATGLPVLGLLDCSFG